MTDKPAPTSDVSRAQAALATTTITDIANLPILDLATVFAKSGFFKDVREQSQAIVKMLYGAELGLRPMTAMLSIDIVEGKPRIAAATQGALLRKSGKYDYAIEEHSDEGCAIAFYRLHPDGEREKLGVSTFTMEDAARAGLASRNTWRSWPKNMTFARAMSNGVKWWCLDAMGMAPIYSEGDDLDAEIVRTSPAPAAPEADDGGEFAPAEIAPDSPFDAADHQEEIPATPPAPAPPPVEAGCAHGHPVGHPDPCAECVKEWERDEAADEARREAARKAGPLFAAGGEPTEALLVYEIAGQTFRTHGITKAQMMATFKLYTQMAKLYGPGKAEAALVEHFGVEHRHLLTEDQAGAFISTLSRMIDQKKAAPRP